MPYNSAPLVIFLKHLKANNNKQWFDEHRAEYTELRAEFSEFVQRIILLIAEFDPAVKHVTAKEAIYRINRDIRFAKDKTLYKTNFGAEIGPGKKGVAPGYHLHIDYDGTVMVAGGLYMVSPQQLSAIRDSIVRKPGALRKIITTPTFKKVYGDLDRDTLTRPPRGFDAGHPDIDLIKLKRFVAWTEWPAKSVTGDLAEVIAEQAKALSLLVFYLRQVVS